MKRTGYKLLSCILAVLMLWSMFPVTSFAVDDPSDVPAATEEPAVTEEQPADPTVTPPPVDAEDTPTEVPTEEPIDVPTEEPTPTPEEVVLPSEEPLVTPEPSATPSPSPVPELAGFELLFADDGVIIARYIGEEAQVSVPASVGDMPVTTILSGAFSGLEKLTSVDVAEGVTTIQGGAFTNCPALTEIKFPASLSEIAEDAVSGCPLAVITAPEGSLAAEFAANYALSLLTIATMDDPLPEYDLNSLFYIEMHTTQMRLTPDGSESINLLAVFNSNGIPGIGSVFDLQNWEMSVYDSDGQPVESGIILTYIWYENDQEQLRVNVRSACETGTYTLKLRGNTNEANYSCDITFEVLSAPTLDFDEAVTLTDDLGRGIPSLMYIGNATIDYSAQLQVKAGSGLDRCEFENVYFNNWSVINLYNDLNWINLQPHDPGSDTLTVRVRGYYGYNEVYYEKTYDISVAEVDFERPTLTLTNTLDGDKLVVGSGTGGANVPFELTYTIEGNLADEFSANVKLNAQTSYGAERLVSDGGNTYHFTEAGLYPVALVATYMNTTVSFNFFVEVLEADGSDPAATFESYFNLDKNPDGDCGTLYYAPGLAISHWVAGFNIVKGAPFEASDVSYDITFIGNDEGGATEACAEIEMKDENGDGSYYSINALPNTAEGAGPAYSGYRLTATVAKEGEPDVTYSTVFSVNMVELPDSENMPAKILSLTTNKVELAYRADNTYSVLMPGIVLGDKSLPENIWLNVYNTDRYNNKSEWGFLLDSENNVGRVTVLSGNAYATQLWYDRTEILKMSYVIDYGNLHWEAPFTIYIGVGESDASALFDVNQQAYTAFIGGLADEYAWGGSYYFDGAYDIEGYGVESVSVPTGGSVKLDKYNNSDSSRTDLGFSFAPSKPGTYQIRLWVDVDVDNDDTTDAVRYDHVFTLKAITTPTGLPTSMSVVGGNQLTVAAGEEFGLLGISINPAIYSQYGWFNNQMIWGLGNLQESGDWSEHGPAENHVYWVDSPGRYKLVRELQIGANYYLREYITLTVTNESNETVVTDVSDMMNYWGWDDAYVVLPKGNSNNDLFMFYENELLLGDDVTEEWSIQLSGDSVGKFASYQFADQYKGDQYRSSEARLVGMFPLMTGEVKFTVIYDAYEGSGEDATHIYHGESPELTVRIVDEPASGDFRLVGTPKTYYTDATGYVHIDAFDAVSNDIDLSAYTVHNDYYADDPNGYVQITYVNDAGEEDWENNTGMDVRIDPTKKGAYVIYQHSWVSLEDTDLAKDTAFRVIVGSVTGSTLTVNENSIDLSVINLRDAMINVFEKYYWVDGATGEQLTWKLTRTKGTSIDLGIVGDDGMYVSTVTSVLSEPYVSNAIAMRIASINGIGLSIFELSITLTTLDGKILTTKKTLNVNVVDLPSEGYLPTLTAPQKIFEVEVGQTVEIPQPTITWPTTTNTSKIQRNWFWSKGDKLGAYINEVDESTRNVIICPLEAGYYTINFEAALGSSVADMVYTVVAHNPGEDAPAAEAQMHAERLLGKYEDYYDTDNDGLIEVTCQMDAGSKVWLSAAVFSMWGMAQAQIDGLTFTLDTPDDTGSVEARISKRLGDCTVLSARFLKEIGNPVTYTIHAWIDGVDTGKSVKVTLLPPRVPTVLDDFKTLTISMGMTYQLDVSALSDALGQTVTAFSCDYDGKTATDTRFTVSGTGLIKATGDVGKAYVYAETDDPAVLAVIEVTVKGAPASFEADKTEFTFTDLTTPQTLTLTAKDSLGNPVPAAIAVSGNNPAVCGIALESADDETYAYTYTVTPVGCGTTSIIFKAMGATVTIPVTVKRILTGVTLTAPETILAGTSGTVAATFDPVDASDKTLVWSTAFADGQDTTGFNNLWITMSNGAITVSKALDRVTKIIAIARWTVDGVEHSASAPLTLLPLVTAISVQPINDEIVQVGTQYVYDISKLDDETEIGFAATVSPAALEEGYAPTIHWASSVASVASIDQNGVVTPIKPGITIITATAMDGSKKIQSVTLVVRKFVTDVTPASSKGLTLVAGSGLTLSLTAACLPLDATLKTVTWQSGNPALLSVNPMTGLVTAVKGATVDTATEVVITATAADGSQTSGTITLTVVPKAASVTIDTIGTNAVLSPTTSINLDIQSLIDEFGNIAPLALSATVTPDDGYRVTWTSSNPTAASISYDEDGNAFLTLRRAATRVTLTAVAGSNPYAKGTAIVNVINTGVVEPTKVTITGADKLAAGFSAMYVATIEPAAATNKSVTWQLLDADDNIITNLNVATLSQTGVLKISALVDTATTTEVYIKAIANGATGVESDKYRVALYPKATGVTISGPDDSIAAGYEAHFIDIGTESATLALTATVSPSKALQAVVWSSSNTKIITVAQDAVDPCKAIVTPVGIGSAKIIATTLDGTKRKAEYTVTVGMITNSLTMADDFLEIASGGKLSLTVERTPALVTNPTLIWTSSNTSVATVSSAGLVTAKTVTAATVVTITATAADRPGLSATMEIRVRPKATSVTLMDGDNVLTALSNLPLKMYVDGEDQVQLTAVCNPHTDDATQGAFQTVIYSSSNPAVASVDAATGLVTAKKAGTAKITATATDGSRKFATVNVTVSCDPTGITVTGPEGVAIGKSVTLKTTLAPDGVAAQAITWSIVTGSNLATISSTGVLTVKKGVAAGQTIEVKATLTANPTISYIFETVTKDPVTSVVTNYGTGSKSVKAPLYQGTMQISATCSPSTALNKLIFTSSNTKVATVDQDGKVTFLTTGTAVITIAAIDGSNSKTILTLTVTK